MISSTLVFFIQIGFVDCWKIKIYISMLDEITSSAILRLLTQFSQPRALTGRHIPESRKAKSQSNICFRKFAPALQRIVAIAASQSRLRSCSCSGYFHKSWPSDLFLINDVSEIWDLSFFFFFFIHRALIFLRYSTPRRAERETISTSKSLSDAINFHNLNRTR